MKDVLVNDSVSFTLSEAQLGYCEQMEYDEEDPRCARLSLGGRLVEVSDKMELEEAKTAVFAKHPSMREWYGDGDDDPSGHDFKFWKMELEEIWLVDFFGGAAHIDAEAWNRGTDAEGESKSPESIDPTKLHHSSASSNGNSEASQSKSSPLASIIRFVLIGAFSSVAFYAGRTVGYRKASVMHSTVRDSVGLDVTEFTD